MRPFALAYPVCALLVLFLTAPASAQYPGKDPYRTERSPKAELTKLQANAPGRFAVLTMNDGTLRGGWVTAVDETKLTLEKQGASEPFALKDIATVTVKRSDRTSIYAVVGYLVTGTVATIIAYNDGDHEFKDLVIVGSVGGIPGGILGAWMGHRSGGDMEIIP